MNDLEIALLDKTGAQVDLYLEEVSTDDFMLNIEEIKRNAQVETPAGVLKARIMSVLEKA